MYKEKKELNIIDNGSARHVRRRLNSNGGRSSGPEAKFGFNLLIAFTIALRLKFTVSICTPFAARGTTSGRSPVATVCMHVQGGLKSEPIFFALTVTITLNMQNKQWIY